MEFVMKFILLLAVALTVNACTISQPELKSPCVANNKGPQNDSLNPCIRRPANTWLL